MELERFWPFSKYLTNLCVLSTLITIGERLELNAEAASHDNLYSNEVLTNAGMMDAGGLILIDGRSD